MEVAWKDGFLLQIAANTHRHALRPRRRRFSFSLMRMPSVLALLDRWRVTVACIVHRHIDLAEAGDSLRHGPVDPIGIGDFREPRLAPADWI
jgi:hypothetical protein